MQHAKFIGIQEKYRRDIGRLSLNENPSIIRYLEENTHLIQWSSLSMNPQAVHILEKHLVYINWSGLSRNKSAIRLLKKYNMRIDWTNLTYNPSKDAIQLLKDHPDKIEEINFETMNYRNMYISEWMEILEPYLDLLYPHLAVLSTNENDIEFLKRNPQYIDWTLIWANPKLFELPQDVLEKNMYKIVWNGLSQNSHPKALEMLLKNPTKINWSNLCKNKNPDVVPLLEQNEDKLSRLDLSSNPNTYSFMKKYPHYFDRRFVNWNDPKVIDVFEDVLNHNSITVSHIMQSEYAVHLFMKYDYERMKRDLMPFAEELIQKVFHPNRLMKICERYGVDLETWMENYM